jgi:hypothetical protein
MNSDDFGNLEEGLDSNHREDSFALLRIDLNGEPNEGRADLMSIKFTYAETPEDLVEKRFKQIKFWVYKEDAEKYSDVIYLTATARKRFDPDTNRNLQN